MFDFIRKYMKVIAIPFFLIIILAFVFQSVGGYSGMTEKTANVASVGSVNISQGEWDAAHKNEVDRIRASRPNIDGKLLDSPEARYATLERLVHERVVAQAATSEHITTTDARLARELQQDPTIASMRLPDGKIDMERYKQLAAGQGLTPEGLEARIRSDLTFRQVESFIGNTAVAPTAMADATLNAFFGRREVQIASFLPADYAAKVNPTDAEIDTFYQANTKLFQAEESAAIEYVVLDMDAVKKTINLNEADVKTYYEQNALRLSGNEKRRASHILISAAKDLPEADRKKAKDKAESLLVEVRKNPDAFADMARKSSQDTGSAPAGGDLDFFDRTAMVKPFADAAFALKKGEISDVVESDFGYHIIKLTDIQTVKQKSFDELRATLEADLKTQQAQREFAGVAEKFANGVFEQSDSLKPVAEQLKLEVKTASNVRRAAGPSVSGLLSNPKFLEAIFNSESIDKKRNTAAVEVGPSQLAAARITQYNVARVLPLDEVRAVVKAKLVAARSAELAKADGMEKMAAWKGGAAPALAVAVIAGRGPGSALQGPVLDAVLRADATTLPAWTGVELGAQGYVVVRINKLLERTPVTPEIAAQERSQYARLVASAENDAYFQMLKTRFKVQIKVPRPAKATDPKATAE